MARMRGKEFARRLNQRYGRRFGRRARSAPAGVSELTDRPTEIAELAEAVADEHCSALPIDPHSIARAKDISISFGDYGDAFDGMLECADARWHIYANTERVGRPDSPRGRFTLAHELGHYYIDDHRLALATENVSPHLSSCEYESPLQAERDADTFAANLLMPARRFAFKAKAAPIGLNGITALAREFAVSLTAAAIRYVAMDLRPCAVVKWNRRGVAWKHLSSSAFRASFRRTFESLNDLPDDSPTRKALAGDAPGDTDHFEAGTTAAAWFPAINDEDARNVIFIEQAISLGRLGVLTFLYAQQVRPTSATRR